MKGTEKIIAHIRADAEAKAEAILEKAEQQAAEIHAEYDGKASQVYADKLRAGTQACQEQMDSVQRLANMEAKKSMLAVKQEMVDRSFRLALEKLTKLPREQYIALLASLAAKAAVTGEETIVLNARDRKAVGQAVVKAANARIPNGKLTLSEREGSFAGGLILSRGSIEANCTLEQLVELERGRMSAEVAGDLFG